MFSMARVKAKRTRQMAESAGKFKRYTPGKSRLSAREARATKRAAGYAYKSKRSSDPWDSDVEIDSEAATSFCSEKTSGCKLARPDTELRDFPPRKKRKTIATTDTEAPPEQEATFEPGSDSEEEASNISENAAFCEVDRVGENEDDEAEAGMCLPPSAEEQDGASGIQAYGRRPAVVSVFSTADREEKYQGLHRMLNLFG